jgi:hypothetical protein
MRKRRKREKLRKKEGHITQHCIILKTIDSKSQFFNVLKLLNPFEIININATKCFDSKRWQCLTS